RLEYVPMKRGPLTDPFSPDTHLTHSVDCGCERDRRRHTSAEHLQHSPRSAHGHGERATTHLVRPGHEEPSLTTTEEIVDRAVESAVVRALFCGNDMARRSFIRTVGGSTFAAALASVFPLAACQRNVKEELQK